MTTRYVGTVRGSGQGHAQTEAQRRGGPNLGLSTVAASPVGAVCVRVWFDRSVMRDRFEVTLADWPSKAPRRVIASGFINE